MNLIKMSWHYFQKHKIFFRYKKDFSSSNKKLKGILFEDLEKKFEMKDSTGSGNNSSQKQ